MTASTTTTGSKLMRVPPASPNATLPASSQRTAVRASAANIAFSAHARPASMKNMPPTIATS